ncbi:alpha/beta-type small acid-soluble spore protein [Anaerobacillus isosaccharinicus]|uniref:Alpha/beta hydrolase n=1 Tax=Anaerobacillus isosaccharinicus TaxID=1532552 RepID=A0A1S2KX53_9BACI|nr:alpha/beta-type small acid-soluble spore protein [Anaerobacillus isosaccharinicus]MBA5586805.1 alpha/beta-type small acid-soluble spore protein [Anaerobacillus isosaccharinicus]QOY34979.1 alpha/beta-type small acid-soluble spore protein [Anaerobacillus isosaccharinicus]
MARKRRLLVPEASQGVNRLKADVMAKEGYKVDPASPDNVKYEVAKELNVPLQKGNNGTLTSKQAGQVGGKIGGSMVKEMIKMAKNNLND